MNVKGPYMPRQQLILISLALVFAYGVMYAVQQSRSSRDLAYEVGSKVEGISEKANEVEEDLKELTSEVESLQLTRRGW